MTGRTILVVEDEEAIAEAVRARLASEGYQVHVVHDGPRAIASVQAGFASFVPLARIASLQDRSRASTANGSSVAKRCLASCQ